MDELYYEMLAKGFISVERLPVILVDKQQLTAQQAISYAILTSRHFVDYIQYLDYDVVDWQEWCSLNRN